MPTVAQRLRQLDRRVLREDAPVDAATWAKVVRRWWVHLAAAVFAALIVPLDLAVANKWVVVALLPTVILSAFQAGRLFAEHERLLGKRTFGGRPRPPGL